MAKAQKPHMELFGLAPIGSRGQVVLPSKLRKKLSISPGDEVVFLTIEGKPGVVLMKSSDFSVLLQKTSKGIELMLSSMQKKGAGD